MLAPRIAIPLGREVRGERHLATVAMDYVAGVVDAGGIPLLIPPLPASAVADAMAVVDGLLLTGGGDVEPSRYGAAAAPETAGVDAARDAAELAAIEAAIARRLPLLAICRGAQLTNVAFGGTLHQDLATGANPAHQQLDRRHEAVHRVVLEPGSLLARLTGQQALDVNSLHHQGVDRLGSSLRAVGFAEDGLIEAFESPEHNLLAVQWQPQYLPLRPESAALFGWLVSTALATAASS